jgi:putative membrane protein
MLTTILAASVLANRGEAWWPLWLLFWLLILVAVAWFLWHRWGRPPRDGLDQAREILAERYAKGELTNDEYRERVEQLNRPRSTG